MSTSYAVHDFDTNTIVTRAQLNTLANVAGYDRITSDVTTDATEVTALTVDVAVLDSQLVLVMVAGRVSCDTALAQIIGTIQRDGADLQQATRFVAPANGNIDILSAWRLDLPGASGTYTYRLDIHRGAGTGDVSLLGSSDSPSELVVIRIGQAP